METVRSVEIVAKQLQFLEPTLTTWVERLEVISQSFQQAPERYYLESTLVGLLAGAAWSNEIQAITEVKIKRITDDLKNRSGRLDLLMASQDGGHVALEAKIIWDYELVEENIVNGLNQACTEVSSIQDDVAETRIGVVFFVPWWNSEDEHERLSDLVLPRLENVKADIKACYYNPQYRYPGAILFGNLSQKL